MLRSLLRWLHNNDLFDQRAEIRSDEGAWLHAVAVGATALVPILPLFSYVQGFLARLPGAAPFASAVLPGLIFVTLLYVISSKGSAVGLLIAPACSLSTARQVYSYTQAVRTTAKFVVLPALALFLSDLWLILPNVMTGRRTLAGFICTDADLPLSMGNVALLGIDGQVVSKEIKEVDDDGFFWSDLRPWAQRPVALRLTANDCFVGPVQLTGREERVRACPAVEKRLIVNRGTGGVLISVQCRRKKP